MKRTSHLAVLFFTSLFLTPLGGFAQDLLPSHQLVAHAGMSIQLPDDWSSTKGTIASSSHDYDYYSTSEGISFCMCFKDKDSAMSLEEFYTVDDDPDDDADAELLDEITEQGYVTVGGKSMLRILHCLAYTDDSGKEVCILGCTYLYALGSKGYNISFYANESAKVDPGAFLDGIIETFEVSS